VINIAFVSKTSPVAYAQNYQNLVDPIHITSSVIRGKEIRLLIQVRQPPKDRIWHIDSIGFYYSDQFGMDRRKIYPSQSKGRNTFSEAISKYPLHFLLQDNLPDGSSLEPELCYHMGLRNTASNSYFVLNYLLPGYGAYRQNSKPRELFRSIGIYGMLITGSLVQSRSVRQYNLFNTPTNPSGWDQRHEAFRKARNAQQIAIGIGMITASLYLHHQFKFFKRHRFSRV